MKASGASGRRSTLIALVSTIVFASVIVLVVSSSPGWPEVKQQFFNGEVFRESLEVIPEAFLVNVKIFLIAEALILPFALVIAVLRSLEGPVFFPVRALAVVYADLFRGIPTILVIYILGFGVPALGISWLPIDPLFWGIVALVLVYSAYVSEVYRAGNLFNRFVSEHRLHHVGRGIDRVYRPGESIAQQVVKDLAADGAAFFRGADDGN